MNKCLILLILFIIVCSGCESNTPDTPPAVHNRTIIVYIGRDNNLSGTEEEKIASFIEGWNGKNGNLIIYEDLHQTSPALYKIEPSNSTNHKVILEEFDEENSANGNTFKRRINQIMQSFPGSSYGLILFSHASGWLPQNMLINPRSLLEDNGEEMELADFVAAIPDNMFEFIIFEACFTAGIELAYELKNKTNYLIGSSAEILSPGFREIYAQQINNLFLPEAQLNEFVRVAFEWINKQPDAYRSGTLSLIKTSELTVLANWLKENIDKDKKATVDISPIQYFDRYSYHLFFDFEDYYSRVLKTNGNKAILSSLISDCVLYKASTESFMRGFNGFDIESHSGLTTYIEQEQFPVLNQAYRKLNWYKDVWE